ncbi:MAG: acyloxyacyl hydrolase [Thermosynechococcaceae cyanobacterium]
MQDLSQSLSQGQQRLWGFAYGSKVVPLILAAATLTSLQGAKPVYAEPQEADTAPTPAASFNASKAEPSFVRSPQPKILESSVRLPEPQTQDERSISAPSAGLSPVMPADPTVLTADALYQASPAQAKDLMLPPRSSVTLSQSPKPLDPEITDPDVTQPEPVESVTSDETPAAEETPTPADVPEPTTDKPEPDYRYGRRGQKRLFFQTGIGFPYDPAESNAFGLIGAGGTYFFADGHSVNLVLNGLYFNQVGSDAVGLNLDLIGRWHILREKNWSFFVDGGAGIIGTTSRVPLVGGSRFNFTPQVGGGLSFKLPKQRRLLVGVRWLHISNADLYEPNTGLDSVYGWVGVDTPW